MNAWHSLSFIALSKLYRSFNFKREVCTLISLLSPSKRGYWMTQGESQATWLVRV